MKGRKKNPDFSGWVTKNDLTCQDGLVIKRDAFAHQDGAKVPLVWNHLHKDPSMILGHAILHNKKDGVYADCYFNTGAKALDAKQALIHGDIESLSIWATGLDRYGQDIRHGSIREVSLVVAGANPGAFVESVVSHGVGIDMDEEEDEGILYTGERLSIYHSVDDVEDEEEDMTGEDVANILETLSEEQQEAVAILLSQVVSEDEEDEEDDEDYEEDEEDDEDYEEDEEDDGMKHNVFENDTSHYIVNPFSMIDMESLMKDAKSCGSFRDALHHCLEEDEELMHALDTTGMITSTGSQTYGVRDPEMLFPDYKTLSTQPDFISRNMDWVTKVMAQVRKTPFSRIRTIHADITEDEARARGYIKGKQKKEEFFTLLKRTTDPQTVYKKQKFDRDDMIDITDFDVVAWLRAEMRLMLNEEIARAILIGDGRPSDSEDKIKEDHIRPIAKDVPLYNITVKVEASANDDAATIAENTIDTILRARKQYKGSGNPTFWITEDALTEMLLLKDKMGHRLYKTQAELATALRVSSIEPVEAMENYTLTSDSSELPLVGVICNLADYNLGANKGGAITMFDDFDIDFNQYKYLLETRCSGALVKPFSAMTVLLNKPATRAISSNNRSAE